MYVKRKKNAMTGAKGYIKLKQAFTLSEVLIALTVIGVIAAITVPALIQRTNKQEYVSALQKAYSTLSQATNMIIAENGFAQANKGGWASNSDKIFDLYKKYLSNIKECGSGKGCFADGYYKYLNGNDYFDINNAGASYRKMVLADGASVMFDTAVSASCGRNLDGKADTCTQIWVDLNGVKKPNKMGADTFWFALKDNGLYPMGCSNNSADCTKTGSGWGCACKVLKEGAINY